jgi:hypothetical protein
VYEFRDYWCKSRSEIRQCSYSTAVAAAYVWVLLALDASTMLLYACLTPCTHCVHAQHLYVHAACMHSSCAQHLCVHYAYMHSLHAQHLCVHCAYIMHICSCLHQHRDDKWNAVLGSCGAGAVMRRNEGPAAMCQGCVSYGAFSVVLDMLVSHFSAMCMIYTM